MPVHSQDANHWVLETGRTAYAIGIDAKLNVPVQSYWGPKLQRRQDYRAPHRLWWHLAGTPDGIAEEYPAWGGIRYLETCLKADFLEGTRDVILQFAGARVGEAGSSELHLTLRDQVMPLKVTLHYRVHEASDIIERWATIENDGDRPILLERAFSAQWAIPDCRPCRLTHLAGQWADECHPTTEWLHQGTRTIESRRITPGSLHYPYFAIDRGDATEAAGQVYFGVLAWSGNWKLLAEVTDFGRTRATIGLNDFDFRWTLAPGEKLKTPPAFAGFTDSGLGGASRALHDMVRQHILPAPDRVRQVLYNSWEITTFDVNEPQQIELASIAADVGIELFVVDDGWFHRRANTKAGLGDWWPDDQKFPRGLKPLIDHVNHLGMDFGLWVEPEMVSPDSDLFRAHPDWVLGSAKRPRPAQAADGLPRREKDQLILNLARSDVQDYLIGTLDTLLRENNIRFIKWDMNRHASEPGWPDATERGIDAREIWVRYVHGLYRIFETLRQRHPDVIWQSCQSGGGRADYGILRYADQVWASDNSEPLSRLKIQEGFSHVLPACAVEAWVTEQNADKLPLAFRFHVSMSGVLGVGGALARWSPEQSAEAARLIADYKRARPVIHGGDLYRLRSPHACNDPALMFVSRDKSEAVLLAFQTQLSFPLRIEQLPLMGLDPNAVYEVDGEPEPRSGAAWQNDGLILPWKNEFSSTMRWIRKVRG